RSHEMRCPEQGGEGHRSWLGLGQVPRSGDPCLEQGSSSGPVVCVGRSRDGPLFSQGLADIGFGGLDPTFERVDRGKRRVCCEVYVRALSQSSRPHPIPAGWRVLRIPAETALSYEHLMAIVRPAVGLEE
ncbi:MAG: hypothetical protein AAGG45_11230, partial [Pseudomonadota bacterium]